MTSHQKIFVVDDDAGVLDSLSIVFQQDGYDPIICENSDQLMSGITEHGHHPILLDVHMPGQSGIEILETLNKNHYNKPIVILSGQGDVPTAVKAMKLGAADFIEKPFDGKTILERFEHAMDRFVSSKTPDAKPFVGQDKLTKRELDVVRLIANGASNKEAGLTLSISPRTVEVHRARIMEKLGARNAADLVRIVLGYSSSL